MVSMISAWTYVRGFEPLSLCDWPGRSSCVLFVGGCNLMCPTCHNADMAWRPHGLDVIPREEVARYIRLRGRWLDGIVVSGGEPTTVKELPALLEDIRSFGLPLKLDSNGMRPEVLEHVLGEKLVDAVFVDVKGPYEKYPALTGNQVSGSHAKRNLEAVFALAKRHPGVFTFRQTRVPILNDMDVEESRGYLPPGYTLRMQQYIPPGRQHATADSETRRMPGNLVIGPNSAGNFESPEGMRHQGPALVQAVGA